MTNRQIDVYNYLDKLFSSKSAIYIDSNNGKTYRFRDITLVLTCLNKIVPAAAPVTVAPATAPVAAAPAAAPAAPVAPVAPAVPVTAVPAAPVTAVPAVPVTAVPAAPAVAVPVTVAPAPAAAAHVVPSRSHDIKRYSIVIDTDADVNHVQLGNADDTIQMCPVDDNICFNTTNKNLHKWLTDVQNKSTSNNTTLNFKTIQTVTSPVPLSFSHGLGHVIKFGDRLIHIPIDMNIDNSLLTSLEIPYPLLTPIIALY
jgi:hypothetical protein